MKESSEQTLNMTNNLDKKEFETRGVVTVSVAHAVHDTYTGFFPALLPLLINRFTLNNTAAGFLSIFMRFPSLLQPIIGHFADRKNLRIFIIIAPAITGSAMSLLTISPNFGFLIFLLVLAGISTSFLHALGPVIGSKFSGNQLGKGMSIWMVGGELGRALGPLVTVTALGYLSMDNFPWVMIAGLFTSVMLYFMFKDITTQSQTNQISIPWKEDLPKIKKVLLPLMLIIISRAMATSSLTIFLPTYLTNQGVKFWISGAALTILEVSGMTGAFLIGSLSDRFGRYRMLLASSIVTPIFLILFLLSSIAWKIPLLIFLGFSLISVVPVIMAIVMDNFSENRSFANGIYMAVSFVIGSIATIVVGILSDLLEMQTTFVISAVLLILGLPIIFWLAKSAKKNGQTQS